MARGMVIVGAGECGARAAFALRERGYDGPVTLIGEEVHLPYERPPLSKQALVLDDLPEPKTIALEERFAEARIDFRGGAAAAGIDRRNNGVRLEDGSLIPYDKLLLATGATPRRLSLPDVDETRVFYLRRFDDALKLRERMHPGSRIAIVGGGFIGLELAASATARGAAATIIESQPRILMRGVPEEIAAVVHRRHAEAGVEIVCGEAIRSVASAGDGIAVTLAGGTAIEADSLIVGIGAVPSTALAERAGLEVENGIAVDAMLQTDDPHIFAAGDCCSFLHPLYGHRRIRLEAWRNAQDQGNHVAGNMLGANQPVAAVPWFWSDQYDLTLQIAGLADGAASKVRRDLGDGAFILFHLDADRRLLAASGVGRGNAVARDIRLAELLIAGRAAPAAEALASPQVKLKSLLSA